MTHWSVRAVVVLWLLAACGRLGFGDHRGRRERDHRRAVARCGGDAASDSASERGGARRPARVVADGRRSEPTARLTDVSGNGHGATCAIAVSCPTTIAGKHGNAIRVNGTQFAGHLGRWLGTSGPSRTPRGSTSRRMPIRSHSRGRRSDVGDSWDIVTWSVAAGNGTCLEDADAGSEPGGVRRDSPLISGSTSRADGMARTRRCSSTA